MGVVDLLFKADDGSWSKKKGVVWALVIVFIIVMISLGAGGVFSSDPEFTWKPGHIGQSAHFTSRHNFGKYPGDRAKCESQCVDTPDKCDLYAYNTDNGDCWGWKKGPNYSSESVFPRDWSWGWGVPK